MPERKEEDQIAGKGQGKIGNVELTISMTMTRRARTRFASLPFFSATNYATLSGFVRRGLNCFKAGEKYDRMNEISTNC